MALAATALLRREEVPTCLVRRARLATDPSTCVQHLAGRFGFDDLKVCLCGRRTWGERTAFLSSRGRSLVLKRQLCPAWSLVRFFDLFWALFFDLSGAPFSVR